uniref:Rab3 GTPase-activating protein catalytic subunit n=1 Tax=Anopheles funestus TaxID=62324 RepID=A0A4Y0BHL8_ANOFN
MLNEEVDDTEFFQQDFTTASDWELFNARLEEIFHEWKLSFGQSTFRKLGHHELACCRWNVARETIKFADVELQVVHYRAVLDSEPEGTESTEPVSGCQTFVDLMSIENDYCVAYGQRSDGNGDDDQKLHPLAQWYGLREFVIVAPVKKSISNESQIRILMSSVHIAVAESSCDVPVFVQAMDKVQHVYLGVCESGPVRMSFDIVHLHITPPTCKYLSGLLEVFKGKIGVAYVDPVVVSVRFTYQLTRFLSGAYISDKSVPFTEHWPNSVVSLPFGVSIDPVAEVTVHCTWPQVADNVVVDSQTYSDFDPLTAPVWSLRAQFEDTPVCYLADCLQEYLQIADSRRALTEYFSELAFGTNLPPIEGANPLDLLTESKIPRLSAVLPGRIGAPKNAPAKLEGPLNDEQLKDMLYYLFPDAQKEPRWPYAPSVTGPAEFDPMRIKSANPDSLVHRLATLLALCNACFGGKRAVAQLWAEFAQEMRYRVERCIPIPGVASGFPDSRTCLLHQKLQMLNVCMERRTLRDGGLPFAMRPSTTGPSATGGGGDQSDEEFFDCSDDEQESGAAGRLSRLGNMLLVNTDEPLYIPVTQEPVPKTEDQLEDDAEVMLKLGPGSELCTQMMSASLLSDMESFKAANLAGQLEDFIRWYSPRDWIEDEPVDEQDPFGRKGHLSARMLIPGNTWQTVWEGARPIPARRQKRLFDDTREAEKVLHFLESRTIGQIAQLTMATLFHVGVLTLAQNATPDRAVVPQFDETIDHITAACCRLSRENWSSGITGTGPARANSQTKYEQQLLTEMMQLECTVTQARSLQRKLFPAVSSESPTLSEEKLSQQKQLIQGLLQVRETNLLEGANNPTAGRLMGLFAEAKRAANEQGNNNEQQQHQSSGNALPDPVEKQFTLRLTGNTISKGVGSPQFLRAILMPQEFRLCGAFSRNTTFY